MDYVYLIALRLALGDRINFDLGTVDDFQLIYAKQLQDSAVGNFMSGHRFTLYAKAPTNEIPRTPVTS